MDGLYNLSGLWDSTFVDGDYLILMTGLLFGKELSIIKFPLMYCGLISITCKIMKISLSLNLMFLLK